jgi:hypothetical protein
MSRKYFQAAIWMMWLTLPITALRYWLVWNRLPASMATHFSALGQPNGWMTREMSLAFPLGLMTILLAVATLILVRLRQPGATSWGALGIFCAVIGVIFWGANAVLAYNLHSAPVEVGLPLVIPIVAILVLVAVVLGTKRGAQLPVTGLIAEEVHAAPAWSLLFIALLLGQMWGASAIPNPPVRLMLMTVSLLFAIVAAHTWFGFQYFFRNSGVEIRTLGFRLRSIPRDDIQQYAVESWNPLRGYGIRGIGDSRAYVWGRQGVRIKTTRGEVFLGHSEPQRLVHDLDAMKLAH